MSTISSASSRKFNFPSNPISSNPTTSATKPAPTAKTPEMGQPPRNPGMQFRDGFDTGSVNGSSSGTSEVGGAGPGSKAFGDKLHNIMQSAGVDDETIKTVLGGLNGGSSPDETSASGEGGEDSVDDMSPGSEAFGDKLHNALQTAGVDDETIKTVLGGLNNGISPTEASGEEDSVGGISPGSKAFGDKLHHAMQSAGVDDETIKTVLGGLNNGQAEGAESDSSGLDTLMSKLDTDSSARLQDDDASLEQLINNPQLTAQLAQAPELFKLLMNQRD